MNNKQLKSLDIIFENCESINVPAESIEWFWINGFKHTLHFQSPNDVFDHYSADYVTLYLKNLDKIPTSTILGTELGTDIKSRIKAYKDVTQITLYYDDETDFNFCVPWGGDSDYTNEYQYVKIGKDEYTDEEVMYLMFSKEKPEDWDEVEGVK